MPVFLEEVAGTSHMDPAPLLLLPVPLHPSGKCSSTVQRSGVARSSSKMQTISVLGLYPSSFSIGLGSEKVRSLQGTATILFPFANMEWSWDGEHLLFVKHLFWGILLLLILLLTMYISYSIAFLFHCFLSVNCLNPHALPSSLSDWRCFGEGEWLIWSLVSGCC